MGSLIKNIFHASPILPTLYYYLGTAAVCIPGSILAFTMLPRWNGESKLIIQQEKTNLQNNKYLITVIPKFMTYNNNNNKK